MVFPYPLNDPTCQNTLQTAATAQQMGKQASSAGADGIMHYEISMATFNSSAEININPANEQLTSSSFIIDVMLSSVLLVWQLKLLANGW